MGTSGSEGGQQKPTPSNEGRALLADPYTHVRTWAGFVYVAFVVDMFAQRIVGWHAATTKVTELVLTPLRITLWDRDRHGTPIKPGQLLHHSDSEYGSAGAPGGPDPHSDGRARMLVPGGSRAS